MKKNIKKLISKEIGEKCCNITIEKLSLCNVRNGITVYSVIGKIEYGKIFRCKYLKGTKHESIEEFLIGEKVIFNMKQFYNDWNGQPTEEALLFWGGIKKENKIILQNIWIPTTWKRGKEIVWTIEDDDPFIAPGHEHFDEWEKSGKLPDKE